MTKEERNQIILDEIELAQKRMVQQPFFTGYGSHSDIFKLSDGRKAQIKIELTVDKDEFEEPTKTFIK